MNVSTQPKEKKESQEIPLRRSPENTAVYFGSIKVPEGLLSVRLSLGHRSQWKEKATSMRLRGTLMPPKNMIRRGEPLSKRLPEVAVPIKLIGIKDLGVQVQQAFNKWLESNEGWYRKQNGSKTP